MSVVPTSQCEDQACTSEIKIYKRSENDKSWKVKVKVKPISPFPYVVTLMAAVLPSQCEDQDCTSELESDIHKNSESDTSKKSESDKS